MANYLILHTKKKHGLERKIARLRRLVDTAATSEELIFAAEEVREARIRVLRAGERPSFPEEEPRMLCKD